MNINIIFIIIIIFFSYHSYSGEDKRLLADLIVQKLVYVCSGIDRPSARGEMRELCLTLKRNKERKKKTYASMMVKRNDINYENELELIESMLIKMDKPSSSNSFRDHNEHVHNFHIEPFNFALDMFREANGFDLCRKINQNPKNNHYKNKIKGQDSAAFFMETSL